MCITAPPLSVFGLIAINITGTPYLVPFCTSTGVNPAYSIEALITHHLKDTETSRFEMIDVESLLCPRTKFTVRTVKMSKSDKTETEDALQQNAKPTRFQLSLDSVMSITTATASIIGGVTLLPKVFDNLFGTTISLTLSIFLSVLAVYLSLSPPKRKGQ